MQGVFSSPTSEISAVTKEVAMVTKAGKEACKADSTTRGVNNPYGRKGKPGGPIGGADLARRKAVEGISADMFEVVDNERYWKNVRFLGYRYRELTGTVGRQHISTYPRNRLE